MGGGQAEDALSHLHLAKDRYEEVVAGRLQEPARLSPVLVERLAEPLFGLYRDMADRLAASGEVDLGLVTRRALVETLHGLAGRLGDPARILLASALADLADDLLAADRVDEAEAAADEAAAMVLDWSGAGSVRLLVAAVRARALTRLGRSAEAVAMLRRVLPAEPGESPSPAHAVGLLALAEALRAEGDLDAAASSERAFDELNRDLVGPAVDPMLARSMVQDLARGVVSRGAQPVTWEPLDAVCFVRRNHRLDRWDRAGSMRTSVRSDSGRPTPGSKLSGPRRTGWRSSGWSRRGSRPSVVRPSVVRPNAPSRRSWRPTAPRPSGPRGSRPSDGLPPRRRSNSSGSAGVRNASRRTGSRWSARRPNGVEAQRLEQERRAAERRAADPAEAERLELERLSAELAELERAAEQARVERLDAERLAAEEAERERAERSGEQLAAERGAERRRPSG